MLIIFVVAAGLSSAVPPELCLLELESGHSYHFNSELWGKMINKYDITEVFGCAAEGAHDIYVNGDYGSGK